jgi:inorganic phosphate transporter, PiT family
VNWLLIAAITMAVVFAVTNGFHDSSNAIAALVATRVARPGQAVVLVAVFHVVGPVVLGTAVADTVGGIVRVGHQATLVVVGAAVSSAVAWNVLTWWRGLPSSSSHALVGGLVGAAVFEAGGGAVRWGGMNGIQPVGVFGVLIVLAVSPVLGFVAGLLLEVLARRLLRRARTSIDVLLRRGEWVTGAALAFSHGANDASKTSGIITLLLVAQGQIPAFDVPIWVKLVAAVALTAGTAFGGWRLAVREAEHTADDVRRRLQQELRVAFSVPLDAEDIYTLSERLDAVLNDAKNAVREAEVMNIRPDEHLAAMATSILSGVHHLASAFDVLARDQDRATAAANAAISATREVERRYRIAMSEALQLEDVRELFSRRELYRRYARMGDQVVRVADRVWYAVVKHS